MSESVWHLSGGCHCGVVRFQARLRRRSGKPIVAQECNCSICHKFGFVHLIVPATDFTLITGKGELSCYSFNSGVAKHYFCRHCGVKSFYIPRSNPDGYSINLRCLDELPVSIAIEPFDGQNWERNAGALAQLSKTEQ